MHVSFRRSGGLIGLAIAADVDTGELPPAQAQVVRDLLAGPDSLPAAAPGAPDRFTYELWIDDGQRRRVLRWQETAVPESVRALIDELTARARPVA